MTINKVYPGTFYVNQAQAFIKKGKGELFVIAYMQLNPERVQEITSEDPLFFRFLMGKEVIRLSGFSNRNDNTKRVVLYHAQMPEEAELIMKSFEIGKGYSVQSKAVYFEIVEEPLPAELERIAEQAIQQHRQIALERLHDPKIRSSCCKE